MLKKPTSTSMMILTRLVLHRPRLRLTLLPLYIAHLVRTVSSTLALTVIFTTVRLFLSPLGQRPMVTQNLTALAPKMKVPQIGIMTHMIRTKPSPLSNL